MNWTTKLLAIVVIAFCVPSPKTGLAQVMTHDGQVVEGVSWQRARVGDEYPRGLVLAASIGSGTSWGNTTSYFIAKAKNLGRYSGGVVSKSDPFSTRGGDVEGQQKVENGAIFGQALRPDSVEDRYAAEFEFLVGNGLVEWVWLEPFAAIPGNAIVVDKDEAEHEIFVRYFKRSRRGYSEAILKYNYCGIVDSVGNVNQPGPEDIIWDSRSFKRLKELLKGDMQRKNFNALKLPNREVLVARKVKPKKLKPLNKAGIILRDIDGVYRRKNDKGGYERIEIVRNNWHYEYRLTWDETDGRGRVTSGGQRLAYLKFDTGHPKQDRFLIGIRDSSKIENENTDTLRCWVSDDKVMRWVMYEGKWFQKSRR